MDPAILSRISLPSFDGRIKHHDLNLVLRMLGVAMRTGSESPAAGVSRPMTSPRGCSGRNGPSVPSRRLLHTNHGLIHFGMVNRFELKAISHFGGSACVTQEASRYRFPIVDFCRSLSRRSATYCVTEAARLSISSRQGIPANMCKMSRRSNNAVIYRKLLNLTAGLKTVEILRLEGRI